MSMSLKSVGAITLFVEDPRRSQSFYEKVFDVAAIYEDEDSAAFGFENTIVNLLRDSAARELIEPGAVAGREAGSRFQLTVWVDDADADLRGIGDARRRAAERSEWTPGNGECALPASPIRTVTSGRSRGQEPPKPTGPSACGPTG